MGFGLLSHRQRERLKVVLFYSILPTENAILSGVINTASVFAPILVSFSVSDA